MRAFARTAATPNDRVSVCLRTAYAFDLRGLTHTPPTVRGPDLGHLTDLCPRGLVGFAVNAEDERPDNPDLLQALLFFLCTAVRYEYEQDFFFLFFNFNFLFLYGIMVCAKAPLFCCVY